MKKKHFKCCKTRSFCVLNSFPLLRDFFESVSLLDNVQIEHGSEDKNSFENMESSKFLEIKRIENI